MKTYWFTVVGGKTKTFQSHAETLAASGRLQNIDIEIVRKPGTDIEEAKMAKAQTILDVPAKFDRICFLDADTFVQNATGHELINGSFREPRGKSIKRLAIQRKDEESGTGQERFKRIAELLRTNGLSSLLDETCPYSSADWNSGVIVGQYDFMKELAEKWLWWYKIIKTANDGLFRRDQESYKAAYYSTAVMKYDFKTIPEEWNWMIKLRGFNPGANIIHRAGHPNGSICEEWCRHTSAFLAARSARKKPSMNQGFKQDFSNSSERISQFLERLLTAESPKGVEVGVFEGKNIANFLARIPSLTMTGVDMWDLHAVQDSAYLKNSSDKIARRMRSMEFGRETFEKARAAVQQYADRCSLVRASSMKAASETENLSLDFVYLDGDHSYLGCRQDIQLWLAKIKNGGYLCGHDYAESRLPGVTQAVDEFVQASRADFCFNSGRYKDWIAGPLTEEMKTVYLEKAS